MMDLPSELERILGRDVGIRSAVESFGTSIARLADDNQLPFFPHYTDHGREHLQDVLKTACRLVPDEVFERDVRTPSDAAVLVCAVLLHDIAMHLRRPGFLQLIQGSSKLQPLDGFDQPQGSRPADRPWPLLWEEHINVKH